MLNQKRGGGKRGRERSAAEGEEEEEEGEENPFYLGGCWVPHCSPPPRVEFLGGERPGIVWQMESLELRSIRDASKTWQANTKRNFYSLL